MLWKNKSLCAPLCALCAGLCVLLCAHLCAQCCALLRSVLCATALFALCAALCVRLVRSFVRRLCAAQSLEFFPCNTVWYSFVLSIFRTFWHQVGQKGLRPIKLQMAVRNELIGLRMRRRETFLVVAVGDKQSSLLRTNQSSLLRTNQIVVDEDEPLVVVEDKPFFPYLFSFWWFFNTKQL